MKSTFILIGVLVTFCHANIRTVNCGHGDLTLEVGEFVKLQSEKYPYSPTYADFSCTQTFDKPNASSSTWIVLYNGKISKLEISESANESNVFQLTKFIWDTQDDMPEWFSFFTTNPKFSFEISETEFSTEWRGYQAFVYETESAKSEACPLDSQSFSFTDNQDVIPITSSFFYPQKVQSNGEPCKWIFKLPSGYKLKLNMKQASFETNNSLILTINNKTAVSLNKIGVQYFEGNYFTFLFTRTSQESGFGGFVSAVRQNPSTITTCNELTRGDMFSFYQFSTASGYPNNNVCNKTLKIPKNTTFHLNYYGFLESGVDILSVTDKKGNSFDVSQNTNWMMDEIAEEVTIKFTSDDNIIEAGFYANFTNTSCQCFDDTDDFSHCLGPIYYFKRYGIMKNSYDFEYCSNMKCLKHFSLPSYCSQYQLLVAPNIRLRENSNDTLKISYDNNLLIKFDSTTKSRNHFLISGTKDLVFEFESDSRNFGIYPAPSAYFNFIWLSNITTSTIKLSETDFTATVELITNSRFNMITVSAPNGYTLDMFSVTDSFFDSHSTTESIFFYDSDTTKNFIASYQDLSRNHRFPQIRHYTSSSNSITIFYSQLSIHTGATVTAFFRLREIHTKNCLNNDNVAMVFNSQLTAKANENGPCIYTILFWNSKDYFSQALYTTVSTDSVENVKCVAGVDPKYTFYEFNSTTASSWTNMQLYGIANSFIIPANSTTVFNAFARESKTYNNTVKGIISSYSFTNSYSKTYFRANSISANEISVPQNSTLTIFVKFLDLSESSYVFVEKYGISESNRQTLTSVNETIKIHNAADHSIIEYFFLNETDQTRRGYLVEFNIGPLERSAVNSNCSFKINASSESMVFGNTELGVSCVCVNEDDYCSEPYELFISIETLDNFEETKTTKKIVPYIPPTTTTKKIALANGISLLSYNFLLILLCLFSSV